MVAALLTTSTLMNRARVDGLHCPAVANSPPQVTAVNLQTAHTPKKATRPSKTDGFSESQNRLHALESGANLPRLQDELFNC